MQILTMRRRFTSEANFDLSKSKFERWSLVSERDLTTYFAVFMLTVTRSLGCITWILRTILTCVLPSSVDTISAVTTSMYRTKIHNAERALTPWLCIIWTPWTSWTHVQWSQLLVQDSIRRALIQDFIRLEPSIRGKSPYCCCFKFYILPWVYILFF